MFPRASFRALSLLLLCCGALRAQGGVPLKTVVTDQTPLNLSNYFGVPAATAIDQTGDLAFIGEGDGALFVRAAGGTSASRLLQIGDPVPGIAGSQIISFSTTIFESQAGILFGVSFNLSDGFVHQAVLTVTGGSNYTTVATDTQVAPASSGRNYGAPLQPVGIDDAGDVAFSSRMSLVETTIFMAPAGSTATRIVGIGDQIPNTTTPPLIVSFPITPTNLNASGELVFTTSELGVVAANKNGQVAAVTYSGAAQGVVGGGCAPGYVFAAASPVINDSGIVAFIQQEDQVGFLTADGLCYTTIGSAPAAAALPGGNAPASIGGTLGAFSGPLVLDDSGNILFNTPILGSSTTTDALLRFSISGGTLTAVAYQGETEPSGTGKTFASFSAFSSASDGASTFLATFTEGGSGIYQQSGTAMPTLVAMAGGSAHLPGGGNLDLSQTVSTQTLNNHSVFFSAYVAGGAAYYADFTGTANSLQSLMSTADTLPSGSRVQLSANSVAAGNFVGFSAQQAGGRASMFVSNLSLGTNTKIVSEGDNAPTGGIFGTISSGFGLSGPIGPSPNPPFFINASGEVAFNAIVIGGNSENAIFTGSAAGSVSKLAAAGDAAPGTSSTFTGFSALATTVSAINNNGQVSFVASLSEAGGKGVFRSNADATVTKIMADGDTAPSGGIFTLRSGSGEPTLALNQSGQVAFDAQINGNAAGLFSGDGTATPQPVVLSGNSFSNATGVFGNLFEMSGYSDSGVLAFEGFEVTGAVVIGTGMAPDSAPPFAVGIDKATTPVSGTFALGSTVGDSEVLFDGTGQGNGEGDVVFRSAVVFSPTTDSGYFISRGTGSQAGVLQALVLDQHPVPGGTLTFMNVPGTPGAGYALGPDGQLAFVQGFTNGSATTNGIFIARQDSSIASVLAAGDTVPGGGIANGMQVTPYLAAGAPGVFAFWAGISGGTANQVIFATQLATGTTASSIALVSSQTPSNVRQSVTFTATVTSAAPGTPTGTVTFFDAGVPVGPGVPLSNEAASFTTSSLAAGSHAIVAQYSGDTTFAPSLSSTVSQQVILSATTTALVSSQSPSTAGQSVTFTASVTSTATGTPTGTVTFFDGSTSLGSAVNLANAAAAFSTATLGAGSHSITAHYSGDSSFASSVSSALTQQVNGPADFSVTAAPSSLNITAGQSGQITLTVTPVNGSTQTVSFACANLPSLATCQSAPTQITLDGTHSATTTITIQTTAKSGLAPAVRVWPGLPLPVAGTVEIILGFASLAYAIQLLGRRRVVVFAVWMLVGIGLVIAGCGGGNGAAGGSGGTTNPGTPAGSYSISLNVTAGGTSHAAPVSVTVTD
jgi:hypothetical protein